MSRNIGAARYGAKSPIKNPVNIYIHGGAVLSVIALLIGFLNSGSVSEGIDVMFNFYLGRLLPWPLHKFLTA